MLFLAKDEVLVLHQRLIDAFGGIEGLRDEAGLESALSAPQQRAHYEQADLVVCAATYAYHLTKAHAFLDGNKRVAAAATELFLGLNDARLTATNHEIIKLFLAIAAGAYTREDVEGLLDGWVILQ